MGAALGAALAWQGERNTGCPGYVRSIGGTGGSETESSHDLVELLGVVSILDLRLHQITFDSAIRPDPKRHVQRSTTQLLWRSVEREGHVAGFRRAQNPSFTTAAASGTTAGSGSTTQACCGARSRTLSIPRTARRIRAPRRVAQDRDRGCISGLGNYLVRWYRIGRRRRRGPLRRDRSRHPIPGWRFHPRDRRQRNIRHAATPATACIRTASKRRISRRCGTAPEPLSVKHDESNEEAVQHQRAR